MNSLRSMLVWDARLQARYGFYTVYAVLTAVYIVGLQAVGPALRTEVAVLLVVTDPTVLGFYFIAAMVLYEKEEGVIDALVTTPLGDRGYLASKTITLSSLAVLASVLVAVLGHGATLRTAVLLPGVALSAALFVLVGFVAVARYDSVNEYFISAAGWGTVLFLPLFGYVGLVDTPLFYLLPAQPVLLVVEAGFRPVAVWKLVYAFGYLLIGNAIGFVVARRAFRRHIVRGGDGGRQSGPGERLHTKEGHTVSWPTPRSPWIGLLTADLRNWTRDPLLSVAAVGPLVLAVVIRFGTPVVADVTPPVVELEPYYPTVTGSMVVFGPAIYGFVVGMFVLEDRGQGVLVAFRTSPLSERGYLLYRGATAYVLSVLATLPAVTVIGLVSAPPLVVFGSVLVGALGGPVIALGFGTLASNTIEGIALSKFVNLLVLGPAVVVAIVPVPFQFVAGVVPTYWPVKAVVAGVTGDPQWWLYLGGGLVAYVIALGGLGRRFVRRTD